MSSGALERAAAVTAAVFATGHRRGSGVLVPGGRVLTAAHVIRTGPPFAVSFRGVGEDPIPATLDDLGPPDLDVALLKLDKAPPGLEPVPLSPIARVPAEVKVFGFPLAEAALKGVWRDLSCSGRAGALVQGDWVNADAGTLVGMSGGPVLTDADGTLVGTIVEGAERGRFDRFAPLSAIRVAFPDLSVPWLFAGEEAHGHFDRRARGQRSVARGGDLFRGRRAALDNIGTWLCATDDAGLPLVITGQPGSGKSAVLARAALALERDGVGPGVAFHARRAVTSDLVDAVAALGGLDTPTSWQSLVTELGVRVPASTLLVAVDALDEAGSEEDLREIRQLLRELARLPWFRVAVATRPLATGDAVRPGSHLHALGVMRRDGSRSLIDLDSEQYFDVGDLVDFAAGMLCQDGADHPGPAGAAWARYRTESRLCDGLARVIAERAGRNYLVAAMAAFDLSESPDVMDVASPAFDPESIPSGVGEALERYLQRLDPAMRERIRGLLTALAYAGGSGLGDARWQMFVEALGFGAVTGADLAEIRDTGAADYLLESATDSGSTVTRLFHQALADELRAGRSRVADERQLMRALTDEAARTGWSAAPSYLRRHAADHAAAAGQLNELLAEPTFLAAADPSTLLPLLSPVEGQEEVYSVYRLARELLSDDAAANAATLELAARIQGHVRLADGLAAIEPGERPFSVVAVNSRPLAVATGEFDGHTARLTDIAGMRWPGLDRDVVVTASSDRTARVWDPLHPRTELARFEHDNEVISVAATDWPGRSHPWIVTSSIDDELHVWDPAEPERQVVRRSADGLYTATWCSHPDVDTPVVAIGFVDGTVEIWDPLQPDELLASVDAHEDVVMSIAPLRWPEIEHAVCATASKDWTVRVWDPLDGNRELAVYDHPGPVYRVNAMAREDGSWYLVTGCRDGWARVWHPERSEGNPDIFRGHTNTVWGSAPLAWPGRERPVVVSVSTDETTRVWNPDDPSDELMRFEGHTESIIGVAALATPGETGPLIATASFDGTARVWDLTSLAPASEAVAGHTQAVHGIAIFPDREGSRRLLVTTSLDRTARVWALDDPSVELGRFDNHDGWVWDVANVAGTDDQRLAITVGGDHMARIWDPTEPGRELGTFEGHLAPIWGITPLRLADRDHDLVVTTSPDGTAQVWDPFDSDHEIGVFAGHEGAVWQSATIAWPGLGHPAIVTTSLDKTARIWDPLDPSVELACFTQHSEGVRSVAVLRVPGIDHDVVVTTSIDETARIWDPLDPEHELAIYWGHDSALGGVAMVTRPGRDDPSVATASFDGTLQIWDPTDPPTGRITIPLFGQGYSVAEVEPGRLIVTTTRGFVIVDVG